MEHNQQRWARRWVGVTAAGSLVGTLAVGALRAARVAQAPGVTSTSITIGATVPLTAGRARLRRNCAGYGRRF